MIWSLNGEKSCLERSRISKRSGSQNFIAIGVLEAEQKSVTRCGKCVASEGVAIGIAGGAFVRYRCVRRNHSTSCGESRKFVESQEFRGIIKVFTAAEEKSPIAIGNGK